jgi:hypothetical protein
MATPTYQAYVANGNGADMLRACLEARGCWKLLKADIGDDTTAWNLWWGNNGQVCPFKRLQSSALRSLLPRKPADGTICCKQPLPQRPLQGARMPYPTLLQTTAAAPVYIVRPSP